MARQQHKSDYSLRSRSHQPPPRDDGDVEQLVVWEQPRKTGGTSSSSDPTEGGNSVEDYVIVEKSDEGKLHDHSEGNEIVRIATEEDDRLCRQVSMSGDYQSARSTPFSSLTSATATHTHESSSTPTAEPEGEERGEGMLSTSEDYHHTVSELKQELLELQTTYQKAENRAKYFEDEYHKLMKTHLKLKQDFQEKEKAMKKTAEELERTKSSIQRHSTAQSQQILVLQDEAKKRDAEIYQVQLAMKELSGKLQILQAEREANDLEQEQSQKTLQSLKEQGKKLTIENATLQDRLCKFGGMQKESRELNTKLATLQEQLMKVSEERDELKFLLEATQAQAKVYEEDFKTERADRTRAFAEREKEGERYSEEIERLQKQLESHKGSLSSVETIHLARQKEFIQAMEDLKKTQEEVQAKTSQVKQYKKQHDGLVAKVEKLERENKELNHQFEVMRQQREQLSKKKPKTTHREDEQARAELEKQVDHYKAKSKARKAELAKMAASYVKAKQELQQVKKDAKKPEKKKTARVVTISDPVSESELHELCRNLKDQNEMLKDHIKDLMETNENLSSSVSALADGDAGSLSSPTELESPPSPDDETPESLAITSELPTKVPSTTKSTGSRPRSSTLSGISHSPKLTGAQSTPHYSNIIIPPASAVKTDIQHADYVNQSKIQEMIAESQKSNALPSSPPDASSLPAPIVVFDTEDSTSGKKRNKPSSVPGSMQQPNAGGVGRGGWVGGLGVMGEGRERRGSAPTWGSNDPNKLHALHERQSQLQSNPYGHASLPESQMSRPPVPTPRRDQPGSQPKPPSGPSPAEREKMKQEEQRQGGDILTPGIATEVHGMAEGVIGEMEEARGGHEVTGTPYDPNLTCVICNRMFRIGEIQLYRTHTETCAGSAGTMV